MYQPTLGRFLSRDPLSDTGAQILYPFSDMRPFASQASDSPPPFYAYVGNSAVNFTDPLGLQRRLPPGRRPPRRAPPRPPECPLRQFIKNGTADCAGLCQTLSDAMRGFCKEHIWRIRCFKLACCLGGANVCQHNCGIECNDQLAKFPGRPCDALMAAFEFFHECEHGEEAGCGVIP
jgi:RHS repeat-associated protein